MPSVSTRGHALDELVDARCSYPSKVCKNRRAMKLNGTMHKLCEFHRKKANLNQKRLQQRRRMLRQQKAVQSLRDADNRATTAVASPIDTMLSMEFGAIEPVVTMQHSAASDFSSYDMHMLENILFGELHAAPRGDFDANDAGNSRTFLKMESFDIEICL